MKKWVCSVCGYVYEGEQPPVECPVCHVDGSKFIEQKAEKSWAAEHVVGVGKAFGSDVPADVQKEIVDGLRANFEGECSEVGMYLAMARVAHREGYPEIGLYWEKAAHEEAEHAAKFAELLGEVVTDSTKKNLEMRVDAENGATDGKFQLAKLAKQYNLDAIHDCARDGPRRGPPRQGVRGSAQALLRRVITATGDTAMKYVCDICGYVYDPAAGDPDNGVAPGTPWEAVPEDWVCPLCGVGKDQFSPKA